MVRARTVQHPRDWEVSGYNEIQSPWQRKSTIDFESLMNFLGVKSHEELAALQNRLLENEIGIGQRDPIWTESIAVGDDDYLRDLKGALGARGYHKQIVSERGSKILREQNSCYFPFSDTKMND